MRRAVYIIIHRRPLPVMADSRTRHRRDGDKDDEDSRPPAAARSATAQGPEPTVCHLAEDEPAGILRQLEHESNEISTERKRELEEERRRRGRGQSGWMETAGK